MGQPFDDQPLGRYSTNQVYQLVQLEVTRAVEELLNGPYGSVRGLRDGNPIQEPADIHPDIGPEVITPPFDDLDVRRVVKELNLDTVQRFAKDLANRELNETEHRAELDRDVQDFFREVSAWARHKPRNSEFRVMLDSFVPRSDAGRIGSIDDFSPRRGGIQAWRPGIVWQGRSSSARQPRQQSDSRPQRPRGSR